jgi:hypothetical protein
MAVGEGVGETGIAEHRDIAIARRLQAGHILENDIRLVGRGEPAPDQFGNLTQGERSVRLEKSLVRHPVPPPERG